MNSHEVFMAFENSKDCEVAQISFRVLLFVQVCFYQSNLYACAYDCIIAEPYRY